MASILLLGVRVPFTRGGADALMGSLRRELTSRGHEVDVIELPLTFSPKEHLLNQAALWRTLDVTSFGAQDVDLVICTKFPSYFVKHPKKSIWLVHQHRPIYDLYGTRFSDFSDDPRDESLRRMLVEADNQTIGEAAYVSGISKNVIQRLKHFNGIQGEVLYPPLPLGSRYQCKESENYILSVGRLCNIKRVDLMIKALPIVHQFVRLKVVGVEDEPGVMEYFKNEVDKHHLWERVEFLGRVSDEELIDLYSRSLAVYYAPYNEDYGYVTLEAFASGKPLIAGNDSGGVLEFARHEENALVVEATTDAIGHAVNRLVEDKDLRVALGAKGRSFIEESGLVTAGWDQVVTRLLSPLELRQERKLASQGS